MKRARSSSMLQKEEVEALKVDGPVFVTLSLSSSSSDESESERYVGFLRTYSTTNRLAGSKLPY
jgi:hypothetical protein